MTDELIFFDSEILPSHYLFKAKRESDGKRIGMWGHSAEHMNRLGALLRNPNFIWAGFNSERFDIPLAIAAASGRSVPELKAMANDIIENNKPAWMTMRDYGLEWVEGLRHIDLIDVAPGVMVKLKLYGARNKSPSIINNPFHHEDSISTKAEMDDLELYCDNDIDETERLFNKLRPRIELREKLSEKYDINLLSKSDAQMAETIIAKQLGLLRAGSPVIPEWVMYVAPSFIQTKGTPLEPVLKKVVDHVFKVNQGNGAVELPDFLGKEPIHIGDFTFQMGVGGLHSKHDKCVHYAASKDFEIVDADVGSFYPMILLNAGYTPRGLGARFVEIYRGFVTDRLEAKATVKKLEKIFASEGFDAEEEKLFIEMTTMMEGGKIMVNGTFGKLGSRFSKIYAPDLMLGITLTGQFYLLTLIQHLVDIGVIIISANTDGVTFGGSPKKVAEAKAFIEVYGWVTNFEFEFAHYKSISLKDCNNYIAVKTDGKIKAKGLYAEAGLTKNPTNEVCTLAAQVYLSEGKDVKDFIFDHYKMENIYDFFQARTVKGGAVVYGEMVELDDWINVKRGEWRRPSWPDAKPSLKRVSLPPHVLKGINPEKLGDVVRWYYSIDPKCANGIRYLSNDALVPKSSGSRPCLIVPTTLPTDIDLQRYVDETIENLRLMGVTYVR